LTRFFVQSYGQVVGYSDMPGVGWGAFVWDETNGMRQLPTVAGGSSQALAVNNLGHVLGFEIGVGGLIWDLNSGTHEIVPYGSAINDLDQVVGSAYGGGAFLWDQAHGTQLLSSLIPAGTGWQLDYAFALNNAGDIVGYGELDGQVRGFLMTPVPEPATLVLGILGMLCATCLRKPALHQRAEQMRRGVA
jgi:hypothetical protein